MVIFLPQQHCICLSYICFCLSYKIWSLIYYFNAAFGETFSPDTNQLLADDKIHGNHIICMQSPWNDGLNKEIVVHRCYRKTTVLESLFNKVAGLDHPFYRTFVFKIKGHDPFYMDGVQLPPGYRTTASRHFTFYHLVQRNSWYSFDWSRNDERLGRLWNHPVVLNTGPLD